MFTDTVWRDIRLALRGFRHSPGSALTVVCTLAAALGLNATGFAVFNAYVLRPTAVRDADALYRFMWTDRQERVHLFSSRDYEQFRGDGAGVFSDTVATERLQTRIEAQPARGLLVSGNYFAALGVRAAIGRTLRPDDTITPRREPVVVLSQAGWQRLFAGDPAILGRQIKIQNVTVEVIGVAAEGFLGLDMVPEDFWAPLTLSPLLVEGPDLFGVEQPRRIAVTGYLRPERTPASAAAALLTWAQRITADRPPDERAATPILLSATTPLPLSFEVALAFAPIAFAFGLVLLTATANIAGLMLSRAIAREREIGVRLSLGATRAQIVRQFVIEALLLSTVAAVAGFVLARVTLDAGIRLIFATLPDTFADYVHLLPVPPDLRVFAVMLAAGFGTALLFGAMPALQATRSASALKPRGTATADTASSRLRHGLVIAQITVSALLIVTSGVLLRGATRLAGTDLGFRTRDVIQIRARERSGPAAAALLASHPLVRGVGVTSAHLFLSRPAIRIASVDEAGTPDRRISHRFVSPEYFDVLEIPLISGRVFTGAEARAGSPVVMISETAAARLWPKQNPVGRMVRLTAESGREANRPLPFPLAEVVGVVRDVATSFEAQERALVYLPTFAGAARNTVLVVRTSGDVAAARKQIDAALTAADAGSIEQIFTLDDLAAGRVYPFQAAWWLSGAIGALALLLTTSGIYGMLSYAVVRRTKEIGIRMALGATAGRVTGEILGQSLRLCVAGLALGLAFALGTATLVSSVLVMMDPFDLVAFAAGTAVVLAVCVAAAVAPARRAAGVEPVVALRVDA